MDIEEVIEIAKKKSLSGGELLKLVNRKANLMTYPQLTKYDDIDKAMGKYKALILLYETKQNYGHWTCVFKRNNNTIEHFDSYGMKPDDELAFIPEYFRIVSNQELPHLTALLYKSGYNVEYNDKKLQIQKKDVNTCGRWVAMRIIFRNMNIDDFIELFKGTKYYSSDDLITLITYIL